MLVLALLVLGVLGATLSALACVVGTGTGASCIETALNACLPGGGSFDGTVTFNCGGAATTITVTSTKTISANTTIDGASVITISGGGTVGVFSVNSGVTFTVENLTIANGHNGGNGGAIDNEEGTLTLTNCTFSGNTGVPGGAIFNFSGTATATDSTFSGNSTTPGDGGAIYNASTLTVTNCTFSGSSIRSFFDTLDHGQLRAILRKRVQDGVLLRLIGKWLHAGVMEDGSVTYPDSGTPQGGVISPLLANIFLHEVLDAWFENEVKPRLRGRAFLVRYADDVTAVFSQEEDARRAWAVLPKRFARYGLTLHPEKTRLIAFRRPSRGDRDATARPTSFDMLGFTHFWTRSLRGSWVIKRQTARDRLSRALRAIAQWCQQHRHAPISWQYAVLSRKLRGHYSYSGITGNSVAITRFRHAVHSRWRKWLRRRGGRSYMSWPHFHRLEERYLLPAALAVHSIYRRAANP